MRFNEEQRRVLIAESELDAAHKVENCYSCNAMRVIDGGVGAEDFPKEIKRRRSGCCRGIREGQGEGKAGAGNQLAGSLTQNVFKSLL
jgi:hypothetical protein